MVRLLRATAVPVGLTVMIGLAGVVLGQVYAGQMLTWLVLGAGAGSVLVGLAARRLPSWLVGPLSVVMLAGYATLGMWAARHAGLTGTFGAVAGEAIRNGIPRLLTAMIPVEPVPETVLIPLVAAWLAGLAGSELAVRGRRVLPGLVPPTLLLGGALYLVGPNAEPAVWPAVAFAAAGALVLATTGRPDATRRAAVPATTAVPATDTVPRTDAVRPDPVTDTLGPVLADDESRPDPATDGTRTVPDPAGAAPALPRAARIRAAVGTATGAAIVVGIATLVGPAVAGQVDARPVDPRRYVRPPQVDSLDENPLIRISGWTLNPDQELFSVTTTVGGPGTGDRPGGPGETLGQGADGTDDDAADGAPAGHFGPGTGMRIRLAVLNDYDGVTWRVGGIYRNAGRVLPRAQFPPGARVDVVRQEITVADLSGRLLPAVAVPQEVTGARVAYDAASGTLIRPEGLTAGLRYRVTSARERPDPNLLAGANVPAGDPVSRVLRVEPGVPEQLQRLADQLAADNSAPYARAVALEEFLTEHYRMVADAPSGHAYPNLAFFLFGPPNGGGQRGTSEQFAAAYSVLGRLMGLPTRVVVGFQSATGTGPVRGADAFAWPEVLFDGIGWVAFDPLPRPDAEPQPVEEVFRPKPNEPPPPEQPAPTTTPTPATVAEAARPASDTDTGAPLLAGAGSTGLLLMAGFVSTVNWLRRVQRRRRLGAGSPGQRVAGAWRVLTDALRLAGRPVPAHLAATEVAAHARSASRPGPAAHPAAGASGGGPPVDDLAVLVNLATFAPFSVDAAQAQRAAELAVAYADALRAGLPWWRRVIWSLHPGPLRWRR